MKEIKLVQNIDGKSIRIKYQPQAYFSVDIKGFYICLVIVPWV
jgi:hypothetical protein